MSHDRVEVICPAGHRHRVPRRHLGKSVRCAHEGCLERFTLRAHDTLPSPTAAPRTAASLAPWRPSASLPVRRDTVDFHDLQQLVRPSMPPAPLAASADRPPPAPEPETAAVPRLHGTHRRRPWFALAAVVALGVFMFSAPVRPCADCGGAGEFGGRVYYTNTTAGPEPAGTTPTQRCGHCSGAGRLTPYQLLYDWLAEQRLF